MTGPGGDAALIAWGETALGHAFDDPGLLRRALTHPSANAGPTYQRLEFLGDRILGAVVAAWLYAEFDEPEGGLTSRFHALVEGPACAQVARGIGVAERMFVDRAGGAAALTRSENVLGDVTEALIAALYLDGGLPAAEAFIRRAWSGLLHEGGGPQEHPKSRLQRWAQQQGQPIPAYAVVRRDGPHHAPRFIVEVSVRGHPPLAAEGASKQEAEKAAARALIEVVGA